MPILGGLLMFQWKDLLLCCCGFSVVAVIAVGAAKGAGQSTGSAVGIGVGVICACCLCLTSSWLASKSSPANKQQQ